MVWRSGNIKTQSLRFKIKILEIKGNTKIKKG
jgi:hypothetical protein